MTLPKAAVSICRDLLAFAIAAAATWVVSCLDLSLVFAPKWNVAILAVDFLFALALFFISRTVLGPAGAMIATITIGILAYWVSYKKQSLLAEPLIANDIFNAFSIKFALLYADKRVIFIITIMTSIAIYSIFREIRGGGYKIAMVRLVILISSILSVEAIFLKTKSRASAYLSSHGVLYDTWSLSSNFNRNGVFVHLVQTAVRGIPDRPSEANRASFERLVSSPRPDAVRRFVFILCEACWYDDRYFKDVFRPLIAQASAEIRGFAPVFGGGTANSEVEFLTGLPVNASPVSGIVYQEYRDLFSERVMTLPSALRGAGYRTVAIHNYPKGGWSRDTVLPRFGFDEFIGMEDMQIDKSELYFPRDFHAYNAARAVLRDKSNERTFIHLLTVHTHGPYKAEGKTSEAVYAEKAMRTVQDTMEFIREIRNEDPEAVVLLYGDHKPTIPNLFDDYSWEMKFDVPVLLFDFNEERSAVFEHVADRKQFFCISTAVSEIYFGFDLPASYYTHDACSRPGPSVAGNAAAKVPSWVYHMTFFDTAQD